MTSDYRIREIDVNQLPEALELVWRVFIEFEAPEYSEEGVREFKSFIEQNSISEQLTDGSFRMWICLHQDEVVGVIATRPPCHISLLFVDKLHHRKGIAHALLDTAIHYFREYTENIKEMTVNSSPYAVEVYRRMGFRNTSDEMIVNGIRFTPMMRLL